MKIDTLIYYLTELREKHGDLEVKRTNICGDYGESNVKIYQCEYKKDKYNEEWVILE